MAQKNIDIIFDEEQKKAKGILSQQNSTEIPELVGLTKSQIILLMICLVMLGAGTFGIGYTLSHLPKIPITSTNNTEKIFNTQKDYTDKPNAVVQEPNKELQKEEKDAYNTKEVFIFLGSFTHIEDLKNIKIRLNSFGKIIQIKEKNGCYSAYLGPYISDNLAKNENSWLKANTGIIGSIVYEV